MASSGGGGVWWEHQGGTTGMGRTESPPVSAAATSAALGVREERICMKKDRNGRERSGVKGGGLGQK